MTLSPTGLSIARSLAPRGVSVYGIDSLRCEIGHYSRWVRHDSRISYLPPSRKLLERLLAFAKQQERPPVLFVAGDTYMDFVAENHAALRQYLVLPDSMRPQVASVILDKGAFYTRCRSLGVAMPATFIPQTDAELKIAAREIRYPAIVKPALGYLYRRHLNGRKLVEVHCSEELMEWWRRIRDWGGQSVVQEVVPGPEANIFVAGLYLDANMSCLSIFTARKLRQYPPRYGSGSYMRAVWSEEIAGLSLDLARRLGYRGVCGTEFKWDSREGNWKLIEVNPRPTLWFALTRAAGVDVIWDAYCDLIGKPNPVHVNCQDDTMRWQLLARDIISGLHSLGQGTLKFRELLESLLSIRNKVFAILSWQDPRTTVVYPLYNLRKLLSVLR